MTPTPRLVPDRPSDADKLVALEANLAERYRLCEDTVTPSSILLAVLNAVADVNRADAAEAPAALAHPSRGVVDEGAVDRALSAPFGGYSVSSFIPLKSPANVRRLMRAALQAAALPAVPTRNLEQVRSEAFNLADTVIEWIQSGNVQAARDAIRDSLFALAALPAVPEGWISPDVDGLKHVTLDATGCMCGLALYIAAPRDGGPNVRQGRYDAAFGFVDSTTARPIQVTAFSIPPTGAPAQESYPAKFDRNGSETTDGADLLPAMPGGVVSGVQVLRIGRAKSLDPVTVYLEDTGNGAGRATIVCYNEAWTCYWGSMGRDLLTFIAGCDDQYVSGNMLSGRRRVSDDERDYASRVALAVINEVRRLIAAAPAQEGRE